MFDQRPGQLTQLELAEIQRELRDHAECQPTIEQLEREFAGMTDEQEVRRLERLIGFLRRAQARR